MEWAEGFELDTTDRLDTLSFLFKNYFTNKERKFFLLFVGKKVKGFRIDNPPHRLPTLAEMMKKTQEDILRVSQMKAFSPMIVSPQVARIIGDINV